MPPAIRLIRADLDSGVMSDGVVQQRYLGTAQGGPLSPVLTNGMLDEVAKEPERKASNPERQRRGGRTGGLEPAATVAAQRRVAQQRADDRLVQSLGPTLTLMTSTLEPPTADLHAG